MLKRIKQQQPKSRGVKNATVASLASLGAFLGAKVAKAAKKKKKPQSRLQLSNETKLMVSAPVHSGRVRIGRFAHKPFEITGSALMSYIGYDSTGATIIKNAAGAEATATSSFNVDPLGAGNIVTDFQSFPATIRNTAANFSRYRFKKFTINYEPFDPTTVGRSVAIAVIPEVLTSAKRPALADLLQVPSHISTPSWQGVSFDALAPPGNQSGLRREWCFLDTVVTTSEAIMRQECVGALLINVAGQVPAGEVVDSVGFITMDYVIELDGMGPTSLFSSSSHSVEKDLEHRMQAINDRLDADLRRLNAISLTSSSSTPYPSQRNSSEEGPTPDGYHVVPQPNGRSIGAVYPNYHPPNAILGQ